MEMDLAGQITPLLTSSGLELYDVEVTSGAITVTVTRPGGVDLEALASANSVLSAYFDDHDPMPGRYNLEVSSPGLERRLRTRAHFEGAIGETVTLRITPAGGSAERVTGILRAADERGITVEADGVERPAAYSEIERARTVFVWGSAPKPTPSKGGRAKRGVPAEKKG
jgi:ribosome maturation factor RimP